MTTDQKERLNHTVFSSEVGKELGQYLSQRLRESKTAASPGEVQEEVASLCAEVLERLQGWVAVGKRAAFGEGCILYWVEKYWRDLEPLHGQYESFHDFAVQETGEDYSTFRMKIAVYRTYILNEPEDPKIEDLGPDTFLDVPLGKLQKAMGAIRRGEMAEEQWDALVDPNVNDRHFYHVMKSGGSGEGSSSNGEVVEDDDFVEKSGGPRTVLNMDSGNLVYYPGDNRLSIKIGWLDVQTTDPAITEIIDRIVEAADIDRAN